MLGRGVQRTTTRGMVDRDRRGILTGLPHRGTLRHDLAAATVVSTSISCGSSATDPWTRGTGIHRVGGLCAASDARDAGAARVDGSIDAATIDAATDDSTGPTSDRPWSASGPKVAPLDCRPDARAAPRQRHLGSCPGRAGPVPPPRRRLRDRAIDGRRMDLRHPDDGIASLGGWEVARTRRPGRSLARTHIGARCDEYGVAVNVTPSHDYGWVDCSRVGFPRIARLGAGQLSRLQLSCAGLLVAVQACAAKDRPNDDGAVRAATEPIAEALLIAAMRDSFDVRWLARHLARRGCTVDFDRASGGRAPGLASYLVLAPGRCPIGRPAVVVTGLDAGGHPTQAIAVDLARGYPMHILRADHAWGQDPAGLPRRTSGREQGRRGREHRGCVLPRNGGGAPARRPTPMGRWRDASAMNESIHHGLWRPVDEDRPSKPGGSPIPLALLAYRPGSAGASNTVHVIE